jgi:nicotinate dehydrogenase subunit A
MPYRITVNGELNRVDAAHDTPLLYVLRNDLGLSGPKFGCGLGQCGACAAMVGGKLTRTCSITLGDVGEDEVTTLEGLGTAQNLTLFRGLSLMSRLLSAVIARTA